MSADRAAGFKKGGLSNDDRKARLKQRCLDDVASKRAKLIRSLRNAPGSVTESAAAIVESMQSEAADSGDPDDPHTGLTEAEYQEIMSSLEETLLALVEEEDRVAKAAEQEMMEMFQASVTLSPAEAAAAEAQAEAAKGTTMAGAIVPAALAGGAAGGGAAAVDVPMGVPCVLCGAASLLQRYAVIFCASDGCGFRLDTTGDALSAEMLSAQAFRVVGEHNAICASAPGIYERHGVLFLECAECMTTEVLA